MNQPTISIVIALDGFRWGGAARETWPGSADSFSIVGCGWAVLWRTW